MGQYVADGTQSRQITEERYGFTTDFVFSIESMLHLEHEGDFYLGKREEFDLEQPMSSTGGP